MNLRDLQYLVAVAEHRHFGKAADACFVSQPTLSTQLKKLEAELGVELVERTPRQVMLTAAGEQVVARARTILGEADAIRGIEGVLGVQESAGQYQVIIGQHVGEAYDEVYKKMRAFAADRGYDLEDGEIESIIEEAEEDGDSVLDCADGALRELVEDWVADHQE